MKNIIITGGSRGIGKALINKSLDEGNKVFSMARNTESFEAQKHPNFQFVKCDLSQPEEITEMLQQIPFEKVDILINNAGLLVKKPFMLLNHQDFLDSFQVNYYAPVALIQGLSPIFNTDAHVVNISTIGGIQGSVKFPELSAYGGTKASLMQLTEILAEEWKDRPLSINCLALGAVQTEMLEEAFPGYQANISADEMAEFIYRFAVEQGPYFNGKILQVSNSTP